MIPSWVRGRLIMSQGWAAFTKEEQEKLIKDLYNLQVIDISQLYDMPIKEVISVGEIVSMLRSDENIQMLLRDRWGDKISMEQMIRFLGSTAVLQELIVSKFENKVLRVLSYLIFKRLVEGELSDNEHYLMTLLLAKFGGPMGCPTPEMYEEKCRQDTEDMLEANKEVHDEKKN